MMSIILSTSLYVSDRFLISRSLSFQDARFSIFLHFIDYLFDIFSVIGSPVLSQIVRPFSRIRISFSLDRSSTISSGKSNIDITANIVLDFLSEHRQDRQEDRRKLRQN